MNGYARLLNGCTRRLHEKKILMIEWKDKKIEDTCDMAQANSACVYVYWRQRLTQIRHKKGKMCYHFFFNKNYYLVALEGYRYEHACPVQNKNFEQKAGSGGKCQCSSFHFGNILTTVTIRKKFTACKIGHFGL